MDKALYSCNKHNWGNAAAQSQRLDCNALNFVAYTKGVIFINASLGIKSCWGQDLLHLSGPTQPPVQWVLGFFYVGKTAVVW